MPLIIFVAIFIIASLGHFTGKEIDYAAQHGVPAAPVLVRLLGILIGPRRPEHFVRLPRARGSVGDRAISAIVTPVMHNFWTVADPTIAGLQQADFMNISMLGTALMIAYRGAGPLSLDAWPR